MLSLEFTIEILIFFKKISVDGGFMALYMGGIFSHMVRKLCPSLLAIAFYTKKKPSTFTPFIWVCSSLYISLVFHKICVPQWKQEQNSKEKGDASKKEVKWVMPGSLYATAKTNLFCLRLAAAGGVQGAKHTLSFLSLCEPVLVIITLFFACAYRV